MAKSLLTGKLGIISGAMDENSIAWKTALQVYAEGGKFVLTNAPLAMRMGAINQLAEQCETIVVPADASLVEDLDVLIERAQAHLGGKLDFMLHSIGMSPNIRKSRPYGELNYTDYIKTLDISALSFHKMIAAADKADALNEYASILALSYIAAQRSFPDYTDMSQAKAMLESIARSYGYHLGKKLKARVNTISQSPTMTKAGQGIDGFDAFFTYADKMSPLGNASAEDCANYIVSLFSDYTRKVTMQNLFHDGGFSSVGISEDLVHLISGNATA
jgi:enoyl-[acyl-carrier protein] reductase I